MGGVSVVGGQQHGAVTQRRSDAVGHGDALWEGPSSGRQISVHVRVATVSYWMGVVERQGVILQNEVAVILLIIAVTLSNAAAAVTAQTETNVS